MKCPVHKCIATDDKNYRCNTIDFGLYVDCRNALVRELAAAKRLVRDAVPMFDTFWIVRRKAWLKRAQRIGAVKGK